MRNSRAWWNSNQIMEESRPTIPFFGSGSEVFGWDRQRPETRSAGKRVGAEAYGRGGREQ